MEIFVTKKYINKKNEVIVVTYNKEGLINNKEGEPAITLFNKEKKIGHIYVENGTILNNNNDAAIYFKNKTKEYSIYSEYGFIHSKDKPAINYKENENIYKYYFKNGSINNINGAAIIKENKNSKIELLVKNNKSTTGYNCRIIANNELKNKAQVSFNIEGKLSLNLSELNVTNIFNQIDLYLNVINMETEEYKYQEHNDLPSIISFSKNLLIEKLMWLNENGLHRKGKPAFIEYLKMTKVKFNYYENGQTTEDLFKPHMFIKNRKGKPTILDFNFLNKNVQNHYEENNLVPFFTSLEEMEYIAENF